MGTFTKTEVVDARQFTGGVKNSKDIVAWITANGGNATANLQTHVSHTGAKVEALVNESLMLDVIEDGRKAQIHFVPGGWAVRKQDGSFTFELDEDFKAKYNPA